MQKSSKAWASFSPIKMLILSIIAVEFILFSLVTQKIGFFKASFLMFLSSMLGIFIIKQEGWRRLGDLLAAQQKGSLYRFEGFQKFVKLFSGILFLIPGFGSDLLALLLLFPLTQRYAYRALDNLIKKMHIQNTTPHASHTIDLDKKDYKSLS